MYLNSGLKTAPFFISVGTGAVYRQVRLIYTRPKNKSDVADCLAQLVNSTIFTQFAYYAQHMDVEHSRPVNAVVQLRGAVSPAGPPYPCYFINIPAKTIPKSSTTHATYKDDNKV